MRARSKVAATRHGMAADAGPALTSASCCGLRVANVSLAVRATVSIAIVIAALVAMIWLAVALADVVGGIVVLVGLLVFFRAILNFAAEPGEEPRRSGRPR